MLRTGLKRLRTRADASKIIDRNNLYTKIVMVLNARKDCSPQGVARIRPQTDKITYESDPSVISHSNHLANLMGGVEVMMELWDGVGNKKFNETYVLYAKFYALPQDDLIRQLPENKKYKDWWGTGTSRA